LQYENKTCTRMFCDPGMWGVVLISLLGT